MILDLGCGRSKIKGAMGVDIEEYSNIDIICDLNKFPYPFKDKKFNVINCHDILEHLDDLTKIMKELYRILKNNGEIKISAPHFTNLWAFSDPTHKHFFGYRTFEFYCGMQDNYLDLFKIKYRRITFGKFFKFLEIIFNKFPDIYESRFAFIFQASEIHVILKKKL